MDRIVVKPDGTWEFQGDDSRLKRTTSQLPNFRLWNPLTRQFEYRVVNRVFCMNCGDDGGLSGDTTLFIKYICDNCFEKGCPDGFIPLTPQEEERWRYGIKENN